MKDTWVDLIIEHPEFETRRRLTLKKYSDWIEGQRRLMPGFDHQASLEENNWVIHRMLERPSRDPEKEHQLYKLARGLRVKAFYDELELQQKHPESHTRLIAEGKPHGPEHWNFWSADRFAEVFSYER